MSALYLQLLYEIERFNPELESIESIFIGGGTPSTISPHLYRDIFKRLRPYLKRDAEITIEANPNSATERWLEGIKELGVNRISFGVQSFNEKKLKALNRSHSPRDAEEAIINADRLGFQHISLDLIYNYQGDSEELLKSDIDRAFQLPIEHISAYELTIEPKTKFFKTPEVKQESDNLAIFVSDEIKKRGFKQYEISNFGRYQSSHNQGYWRLKDYMGIGAGAVGFLKDRRFYPQTDIDRYIQNPLDIREEILSEEEILTERIFLGFRSDIGVDRDILTKEMQSRADFLVKEDKLEFKNSRYTNPNLLLADEVALFLIS